MVAACTNGLDTGFVSLGYAKVMALGVVQGITELMPISSTAHMRLVPAVFGWRSRLRVLGRYATRGIGGGRKYFWSDVRGLVFGSASAVVRRDRRDKWFRLALAIVLGTVPIVIGGLLLRPSSTLATRLCAAWSSSAGQAFACPCCSRLLKSSAGTGAPWRALPFSMP